MKDYKEYVDAYVKLLEDGKHIPLGGFDIPDRAGAGEDADNVLVFSPHPDDECIVGALALRLSKQPGIRVVNVAVTQGSKKERQAARFEELREACAYLGFGLVQTVEGGLEKINLAGRDSNPKAWSDAVSIIRKILEAHKPRLVMIPHAADSNTTHIGTHFLVTDAMKAIGNGFSCMVCENEFWGAHPNPNLMLASSAEEVAQLITGLSFHVGEVQRNPYHLRLPAWMEDNVRRGGELVGGQGGAAPDFAFATLYHMSKWVDGGLVPAYEGGKILDTDDNPADILL